MLTNLDGCSRGNLSLQIFLKLIKNLAIVEKKSSESRVGGSPNLIYNITCNLMLIHM